MKFYFTAGAIGIVIGFLLSWFIMTLSDGFVPGGTTDNMMLRQTLVSHCQQTPVRVITCPDRIDTCICGNLEEKKVIK